VVQSKLAAEPRWVVRGSDLRAWLSSLVVVVGFGVALLLGLAFPVTRPEPSGLLSHAFLWPVGVASLVVVVYRRQISALARRLAKRSPSRRPHGKRIPRTVPG
jgi:hypothetical protein